MSKPKESPYGRVHYVRLPKALYKELNRIADVEFRTLNSIIQQAVKEFLDRRAQGDSKKGQQGA